MVKKSKKTVKKSKKSSDWQTGTNSVEAPIMRLRKLNRRQSQKRRKEFANQKKLPGAWDILRRSIQHLYRNKKLFLGIIGIYALLNILFVKGIAGSFQLESLRQQLSSTFGGQLGTLGTGITLFGLLIGSATNTQSEGAGAYQTVIVIVISLAIIWALRQTYGETKKIRVRDAFYLGLYPLAPLLVVLFFILIQLIPFVITSTIYSEVIGNGLVVSGAERILWIAVFLVGLCISLYFISSSVFAFYIVTLPGGQPRAALKEARKLVKYRRFLIIRKLIFLPVIFILFSAIVLIPLIILFAPAAEILFFIFTILVLAMFHSYVYTLYRDLL